MSNDDTYIFIWAENSKSHFEPAAMLMKYWDSRPGDKISVYYMLEKRRKKVFFIDFCE
jgi:hypothetical protein